VRVKKSSSLIVLGRGAHWLKHDTSSLRIIYPHDRYVRVLSTSLTWYLGVSAITCRQCGIRSHGNVPHQIFIKADHLLWSLMLHGRSCCSCYMLHHFNVFICTNNTTLSSSSSLLYRNVLIVSIPSSCLACVWHTYRDDD
jgi:hypothetical protein